jgi:hypothetical protein
MSKLVAKLPTIPFHVDESVFDLPQTMVDESERREKREHEEERCDEH